MKKQLAILTALSILSITACSKNTIPSDLSGQKMDLSLKDQRPVAVFVNDRNPDINADIVYEFGLSDGGKSLYIIKDWKNLQKFDGIAEDNNTADQIAPEYNAVLITASGPSVQYPYLDRIDLTSVDGGSIEKAISDKGYSESYNDYRPKGDRFLFSDKSISSSYGAVSCASFNTKEESYTYDKNKKVYKDSSNAEYTNIILQDTVYLGLGGEDSYNLSDMNRYAWLVRGGYAIPLTWVKTNDLSTTQFFDLDGQEITLTPGKTLIKLIVPEEWDKITIGEEAA